MNSSVRNSDEILLSRASLRLFSPIMEEGILIAVAIVVILGVIGIIFAVFSWLDSSSTLWNQF